MKRLNLLVKTLITAALGCPILLSAQEKDAISISTKIDSIYSLQKKMYVETHVIPLENKKYGVEVNLFRFLIPDIGFSFSGTFSMFDVNRHAELAFPIYFQNNNKESKLITFTADGHYRYFLGEQQKGFYLSGFARFAHIYGTLNTLISPSIASYDSNNNPVYSSYKEGNTNKLGVGVGLGYRIFSKRGFYWGTSLSIGRYIIGKNDIFNHGLYDIMTGIDDSPMILDIEFLKFGWAF